MSDEITELPTKLNPLPAETRAEAAVKRKAQRAFAAVYSPFVRAMWAAMASYDKARAEGMERADAERGIEAVLRSEWPTSTTKFPPQCDACDDTGYVEHICRPYVRCQRDKCSTKGEDWQHRYVVPCHCPKGDRFRQKVNTPEDALASAGNVSKSKGFTRLGR